MIRDSRPSSANSKRPTKERVMERYIAAVVIELERALGAAQRYEDLRYCRERHGGRADTPRQVFDEFYAQQSEETAWAPARSLRPGIGL
jgi:hypothetical protein